MENPLNLIEVLGRQCADGGTCHHECKSECFRKTCCVPLSAARWLNVDWTLKQPPLNERLRAMASGLSYNDAESVAQAKFLMIEAASHLEKRTGK